MCCVQSAKALTYNVAKPRLVNRFVPICADVWNSFFTELDSLVLAVALVHLPSYQDNHTGPSNYSGFHGNYCRLVSSLSVSGIRKQEKILPKCHALL